MLTCSIASRTALCAAFVSSSPWRSIPVPISRMYLLKLMGNTDGAMSEEDKRLAEKRLRS
jgi:hypothetical protein